MIAGLYCVATAVWWYLFRRFKTFYVLSIPFALYGLAFFLLAMGMFAPSTDAKYWFFNVATGFYAFSSASGSLFFSTNFGTEGKCRLSLFFLSSES